MQDVRTVIRLPVTLEGGRIKNWGEVWDEITRLRPNSAFLPNLQHIRLSNLEEELLSPFLGTSGRNLRKLYIKFTHGRKTGRVLQKFLRQLQHTANLGSLFVREGADIIPQKLIQESPLKRLRLEPSIHARCDQTSSINDFRYGMTSFKSHPWNGSPLASHESGTRQRSKFPIRCT